MAVKDKFTWRIENFSTLTVTESEIHSPSFSLKGHQWKIRFDPKGFMDWEFIRPYLEFAGSEATVGDGGILSLAADFRLTMVNQVTPKSSIEASFTLLKKDYEHNGSWVYKPTTFFEKTSNLVPKGFLVNDTLIFEAQIRKSLEDTLHSKLLMLRTVLNKESGARSDSEHILGDITLEDISENIPRTKERLKEVFDLGKKKIAKYGDRLLQTIESTISDYNAYDGSDSKGDETSDSVKRKRESATTEPSEAIDSVKRMRESATSEPFEAIDSTENKAQTSTIMSPYSLNVQSALKNMIAELSTVASSWKSNSVADVQVSTNDVNHGSALLEEQRGKLSEFYDMSLEAICRANLFDSVHEVVLKISELANDPFEKRVLKDILSRLVEFKTSTLESVSIIESFPMIESSNVQTKKQIEVSLTERQNQLMFLDSDVSRIEEDQLKVDAEIQQLLARKDKLVHEKNLALADMEAATREASRELGELKRKHTEHEQARSDVLRAKERLAQNNASWKHFKENSAL
ncbi:ATP-dependent DNA helicase Q-like 4A [Linum perenne]